MRALVLAGGTGTRLRPLTHTSAKQMVPVANKPVLFYGLESIARAGIIDVGIVVGDTAAEIRAAVGDGSRFGLKVTYIPQHAPLGLAHAVLVARDFLGEEDFLMYLGDNFICGGITGLVEDFQVKRPDAHILLTRVADPGAFGVAELGPDGRVVGLEEKPERPRSDLVSTATYLFHRDHLPLLERYLADGNAPDPPGRFLAWLHTRAPVYGYRFAETWFDIGDPEQLLEADNSYRARLGLEQRAEYDPRPAS